MPDQDSGEHSPSLKQKDRLQDFLIPSWWSVFLEALLTVDGSCPVRLKGDFPFLTAVRTYDLIHFSCWSVRTRVSVLTAFFHYFRLLTTFPLKKGNTCIALLV